MASQSLEQRVEVLERTVEILEDPSCATRSMPRRNLR